MKYNYNFNLILPFEHKQHLDAVTGISRTQYIKNLIDNPPLFKRGEVGNYQTEVQYAIHLTLPRDYKHMLCDRAYDLRTNVTQYINHLIALDIDSKNANVEN